MTKKYEKFEEWMIGKTVLWDGDKGVVTREYKDVGSWVWVEWEDQWMGEAWVSVESLTFLNTPCSDTQSQPNDSPIPWEVGQIVWDAVFGKGVVRRVEGGAILPVKVEFDDGDNESYTLQGCYYEVGTRTLFFSEPTIIADTMPPKKPFVPKLKFDDKLMVINSYGKVEYYGCVEQEFEDSVAMRVGDVYEKVYYKFFKLGEEIKWEN